MPILVPVLSAFEKDPYFIDNICANSDALILISVIDAEAMPGRFGFAANEIRQASNTLEIMENRLREKNKPVKTIEEWGSTVTKIDHAAQLYHTSEIRLLEQKNRFFEELVRELMGKGHTVTIVPLPITLVPKKESLL